MVGFESGILYFTCFLVYLSKLVTIMVFKMYTPAKEKFPRNFVLLVLSPRIYIITGLCMYTSTSGGFDERERERERRSNSK